MGEQVIVTDVGPRDGLQNQPELLTVEQRLELVHALCAAGISRVEVGSFVSPKAVPAMADTDQIFAGLTGEAHFIALIPNMKGYELARTAGAKSVTLVLYGSEGMAQKNVSMSMAEAEQTATLILQSAKRDGIEVIATVAVAFECPFDGPTNPALIESIVAAYLDQGADQVVLADTIGAANPQQVRSLTTALVNTHGVDRLGCHFHDTRAMGLANVYSALESGIRRFDSSIAGLGGCPFAPGASGNVATDDVVMMLHQMGFETGIELDKLMQASDLAEQLTGTALGGRSKPWLKKYLSKQE